MTIMRLIAIKLFNRLTALIYIHTHTHTHTHLYTYTSAGETTSLQYQVKTSGGM